MSLTDKLDAFLEKYVGWAVVAQMIAVFGMLILLVIVVFARLNG